MSTRRRVELVPCLVATFAVGCSGLALTYASASDARPAVRGAAATSMARPAPRAVPPSARTGARIDTANRTVDRNRINTGDRVVRAGNNVNINIDNDGGWGDWNDHHHPVATGVAFGAAAAVTSAAIGSRAYSLPPACTTSIYGNVSYYACNGVWYAPQYQGDTVVYVVVDDPSR